MQNKHTIIFTILILLTTNMQANNLTVEQDACDSFIKYPLQIALDEMLKNNSKDSIELAENMTKEALYMCVRVTTPEGFATIFKDVFKKIDIAKEILVLKSKD